MATLSSTATPRRTPGCSASPSQRTAWHPLDGVMSFTLEAAEELGVPNVLFWTTSACGFLAYAYYCQLVEKGFVPLKAPAKGSRDALDPVD
ncbi:hypothetical protein RJ639_021610 [Escallonia herrerae]|uniref:Uncharacterized protein n=1 Tax=Escallonia herrerae TaxID=1293975 RepID=A0AA88V457_9ASTE|nr:hypothetical protein RJ639_021610 [Escallonia herrerae]